MPFLPLLTLYCQWLTSGFVDYCHSKKDAAAQEGLVELIADVLECEVACNGAYHRASAFLCMSVCVGICIFHEIKGHTINSFISEPCTATHNTNDPHATSVDGLKLLVYTALSY